MGILRGLLLIVIIVVLVAMRQDPPASTPALDRNVTVIPKNVQPPAGRPPRQDPSPPVQTAPQSKEALINALGQQGIDRKQAEENIQRFEANLRDPMRRRLMECAGLQVYKETPAGWQPPSAQECRDLRRKFSIPD